MSGPSSQRTVQVEGERPSSYEEELLALQRQLSDPVDDSEYFMSDKPRKVRFPASMLSKPMMDWDARDVTHMLAKMGIGQTKLLVLSKRGSGAYGTVWVSQVTFPANNQPHKPMCDSAGSGELPPPGTVFATKLISHESENAFQDPDINPKDLLTICQEEIKIATKLGQYATFPSVYFTKTFTIRSPRISVIGMELVGESCRPLFESRGIRNFLDTNKKLIGFSKHVVDGLQAMIQAGIFHLDFNASNISICSTSDGFVHPMILDFGCCKRGKNRAVHSDKFPGTMAYWAPEVLVSSGMYGWELVSYTAGLFLVELFKCTLEDSVPGENYKIQPEPQLCMMDVQLKELIETFGNMGARGDGYQLRSLLSKVIRRGNISSRFADTLGKMKTIIDESLDNYDGPCDAVERFLPNTSQKYKELVQMLDKCLSYDISKRPQLSMISECLERSYLL
eukprot:983740_1